MSKEAITLQHDMFTGDLVDTRSRKQKEIDARRNDEMQMNMFSIQEAPIGLLRAKPVVDISELPSPPLVLQREDPRTEEEKEADLRREAEALTVNMFTDEDEELGKIERVEDVSDEENPQLTAYLELVPVMQEQITTTWIDENYKQVVANQLPFTILEAIRSGMNYDEVAAAMKIGQFLGKQSKQIKNNVPEKPKRIVIPVEIEKISKIVGRREGYRRKSRQQQTKFRVGR